MTKIVVLANNQYWYVNTDTFETRERIFSEALEIALNRMVNGDHVQIDVYDGGSITYKLAGRAI